MPEVRRYQYTSEKDASGNHFHTGFQLLSIDNEASTVAATWLLLDANYLCYRAFYSTGELMSGDGDATGTVYGFLRDVIGLQDLFATTRIAFFFDGDNLKRKQIYACYKASRKEKQKLLNEEEREDMEDFYKQVNYLRTRYLPYLGFNNVFCEPEYEGDDLIAAVCAARKLRNEYVIVTSDKDLYQCLAGNVKIYNPASRKTITIQSFFKEWKIAPEWWPRVKAIAGCKTDDVRGVPGIGEKLAAKYLLNQLPPGKRLDSIEARTNRIRRNFALVALPMDGTPTPMLLEDEVTPERWAKCCRKLGFRNLQGTTRDTRQGLGL